MWYQPTIHIAIVKTKWQSIYPVLSLNSEMLDSSFNTN